jgi:hypothetical protein
MYFYYYSEEVGAVHFDSWFFKNIVKLLNVWIMQLAIHKFLYLVQVHDWVGDCIYFWVINNLKNGIDLWSAC